MVLEDCLLLQNVLRGLGTYFKKYFVVVLAGFVGYLRVLVGLGRTSEDLDQVCERFWKVWGAGETFLADIEQSFSW